MNKKLSLILSPIIDKNQSPWKFTKIWGWTDEENANKFEGRK